ncbi:MAG TPA: transporter substrate-binding domain-containing protein, partial [Pyrinomonadaceae bacterium]
MRKLIGFIVVTLAGLLSFVTSNAQQVLRWGADPSGGAPYVFNDPNHPDQYIGYEKEMVDALAAAMGRRPDFVASDWETLVSALQRG